jgi:hypothetical protein
MKLKRNVSDKFNGNPVAIYKESATYLGKEEEILFA